MMNETMEEKQPNNNNGLHKTSYSRTGHSKENRYQGPRHWHQQRLINDTIRWPNKPPSTQHNEISTAALIARCLLLTSNNSTSINKYRRDRSDSDSMGENSAAEESDRASTIPSQMPRSHTSQGVSTQQVAASNAAARPSTVIGCSQKQVKLSRSRPDSLTKRSNLKKTDHKQVEGWNKSTKIDSPKSTRIDSPKSTKPTSTTATTFVARPSQSNRVLRNMTSVTVDLLAVRNMYDPDAPTNAEYLQTIPSQNKAVEAAFTKAINHRTVTSDRLRVGLLTNDITPRVYLKESKGTGQFKKMNLRLREQLSDVYNYRYTQSSLPSSLSSDCDSNDERSDGF